MKYKLTFIILTSALMLFSKIAMADPLNQYYLGVQYAVVDYNEQGFSKSFSPSLLVGRFGKKINSNFSVEARMGLGVQDDTKFLPELGVSGLDASLELDSMVGLYATGHINFTESSSIYGVLGISRINGSAKVPQFPASKSSRCNNDGSYGIGADIGLGDNVALNIEYMQYLDKSDFDLGAIAVGVVLDF